MPPDILLIDDSPTDLKLLLEMMKLRQWRIAVAFDGEKGCHLAHMLQPMLILLDVRMPDLDGISTCRLLKTQPATHSIPVIFLTAANDLAERLEGFAAGAVDYIGKPFHEEEVLARIGVHLRPVVREMAGVDHEAGEMIRRDAVLLRTAQALLRERVAAPPSLDDLAKLVGTNRRRLGEVFQSSLGQPVFAWLREERLRQAHHLVCCTEIPIAQIGEHLGYSSPANFSRAFGERFGFSPSNLRREIGLARQPQPGTRD
jgi:DNA-binding response OmpR family regulator